ncbi:MAG: class I SAM-dependent methyltransferase [candidate division Zixibacteria bacterium]|nr:class I SAM-dependent methyltransferase [Deltaproteobacteria bacterium]MCK4857404.1 class I SAM-dependent methyltransferase [candidate division Zixibacteria bacterium]
MADLRYPGLRNQPDQGENRGWLRKSIQRFLRAQFGRPTGFWGNTAGKIMARTPSNQERIRWTISLLDIGPDDRLLEIGFGPGFGIELVSKIASEGFVVGIDHSEVMVRQASKRNAKAIRDGKVVLKLGSVSNLLKFNEPFDKIFTINSIHFWTEPIDCLKELRKLLRPGGVIGVTLQPRSRSATDETTKEIGEEVAMNLERAGFSKVRLEIRQAKPVSVACALGIR